MTFITYAQNFEDLMLWRALKHVKNGFYIDVGAYDPVEYSVTKAFYDAGWRGINIEPAQEWFEKLEKERPGDINVQAVAAKTAGQEELYAFRNTGLSTTSQADMHAIVKAGFGRPELVKVRSVTIDDLCAEYDVETIHFLKIDAEGAEGDILRGAEFTKYRPWIVVVEATAPFSNTDVSDTWEPYLLAKDYLLSYFDGLNKFFVAREHEELCSAFSLPPNVIDDYVPASKIALEHEKQQALQQLATRDEMLRVAEKRVADLDVQLEQLGQQISDWDARLKESEQVAAERASKFADGERRLAASEHLAAERAARIEQLEHQLSDRDRRLAASEHLAAERGAMLEERERQSAGLIEEAAMLRERIARDEERIRCVDALETAAGDLRRKAAVTEARLSEVDNELNRVRGSVTWKVAKPVWQIKYKFYKAAGGLAGAAKPAAIRVIFFLYPLVVRRRAFKSVAWAVLNRFPILRQRVLGALIRRQIGAPRSASVKPVHAVSPVGDMSTCIVRHNERIVLFYVEFTASFNRITGIQRVCHKLAGMLEGHGETIVLIKLDPETLRFAPLNATERAHFLKQAGYASSQNDRFYQPEIFDAMLGALRGQARKPWLIIPEVTYHTRHPNPPTARLIKLARDFGLRVGVIYYDMIPFVSVDASENARKHAEYTSTVSLADVIWPISRWSADLLIDYYQRYDKLSDFDMPQISVALLAEEMDAPRQMIQAANDHRSIVCVGTIDERKNQVSLIRAFNKYCSLRPNTEYRLHIVGMVRDNYRSLIEKEASHNPRIEFHYHASDEDIKRFYLSCDFTVFPSLEEGYGLPIVESLWNLKPCICANFGSMGELSDKGGCVAANMRSVDALLGAITALIEDKELYQSKIEEILRRPMKTWFEYAGEIVAGMDRFQFGKPYGGLIYYWVDATLAASSNTGIQRVNRQLARHLIMQGHKLVPIKWDDSSSSIILASVDDLEHLARWNGPATHSWVMSFDQDWVEPEATYLLVELPLNRSLDVQQRVVEFFRRKSIRRVAIFYDAIPYKLAAIYPPDFTDAHMLYMELLDRMDLIIPISGTSAKDLNCFLSTTKSRALSLESRIQAVDLPAEFPEGYASKVHKPIDADSECNILVVGTVEPRKNHETLIRAFIEAERISPRRLKLTIVGGDESFDRNLPGKISALIGNSNAISWIKKASDSFLREQYENANFSVFPSIEEGFGMPILESLWFGVPCICSRESQMGELAAAGGCEMVDVRSVEELSNAIVRLANAPERIRQLKEEILGRHFKSWNEYGAEVSARIRSIVQDPEMLPSLAGPVAQYQLPARPVLSICITTYNRAGWLSINLENLMRNSAALRDKIEIIVCDNCSNDSTLDVAAGYIGQDNFLYFRNTANIGMLNNLAETVAHAHGDYVWLIGDDDLIHRGALERIIGVISEEEPDLINVNYAYTPAPIPPTIDNLEAYLAGAVKIAEGGASTSGAIKQISAFNENFFTAIYTFIVQRKYAQKIFNQDTSGEPFSNMQSCVPSSKYIFSHMMELAGYWIDEPLITINMNVSWGKYAPLWILERLPEVYDFAELNGVPQGQVDRWRQHTLQMVPSYLQTLFESEFDSSFESFDMMRFIRRSRHLRKFREFYPNIEAIYAKALAQRHPLAKISKDTLKAVMQ